MIAGQLAGAGSKTGAGPLTLGLNCLGVWGRIQALRVPAPVHRSRRTKGGHASRYAPDAGENVDGEWTEGDRARKEKGLRFARNPLISFSFAENGGPCRTRTYNQLIKSQLLYQLS